jgi:hypothetical protein
MIASLVRTLAGRRVRNLSPETPQAVLCQLLRKAQATRFGREFGFAELLASTDPVQAFAHRVPLFDYPSYLDWLATWHPESSEGTKPLQDESWPGKINWFCLSSGTSSGKSKFLPYSREMAAQNRKIAMDFSAHIALTLPSFAPWRHKTLYMSGSTRLSANTHGVIAGDMSALTRYLAPSLMRCLVLPDDSIARLEPWDRRLRALVELCLRRQDIAAVSGIPIWQLTFFEALTQASGKTVAEMLPALRVLIHGGMSIVPYRERLRHILGPQVSFLEVYAASELGIAAYQVPGAEEMAFQQSCGVYCEFEAPDGTILPSEALRPGVPYGLLVSNCAGLWRYRLGDRLIFSSVQPLLLQGVYRDKTTSCFDEKITEGELEKACEPFANFGDYCMGPDVTGRRHAWFLVGPLWPSGFSLDSIDSALRAGNQDYDDYRSDGRINPPRLLYFPQRSDFLRLLDRQEGGQRKFPRLLSAEETARLLNHSGEPPPGI